MMGSESEATHTIQSNKVQSEYFRKSRKAAYILRSVFHSQTCLGKCGSRVCACTTQLLKHMAGCSTVCCPHSGCLTTKRLMQHFAQCQTIEPVVARPLSMALHEISSQERRGGNTRKFCLICALATSKGEDYCLDAANKDSPSSLFETPISSSSTSMEVDIASAESKSTFSVHFSDDTHASLSKSSNGAALFGYSKDAVDDDDLQPKRFRRHSMDSMELLGQREDAECIQLITPLHGGGSGRQTGQQPSFHQVTPTKTTASMLLSPIHHSTSASPIHAVDLSLSNASIMIVRDVTALRNYSVSWSST
jgi:hypothetical protein